MYSAPAREAGASARLLTAAAALLDSYATRIVFSILITLSVLPHGVVSGWIPGVDEGKVDLAFFCIFAPEFLLRAAIYLWRRGRRQRAEFELLLLVLDLLAVISFLPLAGAFRDVAYFRLFRLTRLVLLLGYWGGMVHDLWRILTGRERRYQVIFVLFLGIVLSFAGAVVLVELGPGRDYNGDGSRDARDQQFGRILWWSFLQVQSPDNLIKEPSDTVTVIVSLLLTFAGLLLLSFIIGMGTSAVDELLRRSLDRPVGMRAHNVILGLGQYSRLLLEELADIYRKNDRPLRAAVLGRDEQPPEYFVEPALRGFRYRDGDPVQASDLDKVNVAEARRVLVLATDPSDPDARVISTILAARTRAPDVHVYADLRHERNFLAARMAGGARTHVIGSGTFLGYYLAQNVVFPGISRLYRQLLTSVGAEVYTYVYGESERSRLRAPGRAAVEPADLHARAALDHRVTLLGVFAGEDPERALEVEDFTLLLNPASAASRARVPLAYDDGGRLRPASIRGFIGVALCWEDVRGLALSFLERGECAAAEGAPPGFESLRLEMPAGVAERVLICGASARVPRVARELLLAYGRLDLTVLVREEDQLERLCEDLRVGVETSFDLVVADRPARDADQHPGRELVFATALGESRLRVLHTDWSDVGRILRNPAIEFERMDAVLFLPREAADFAGDGMVALDCLRLAQVEQEGSLRFSPGFRALGMVHDPVQAALLEQRLDRRAGAAHESRWSIVCGEKLRHDFIVQNVFVPGLSAIFLEILGSEGQHVSRLVPRGGAPGGDFAPWDLGRHLLAVRGSVLVGLDRLRPDGEVETVLDPGALGPGARFPWHETIALYVLAPGPSRLRPVTPAGAQAPALPHAIVAD